MTTPAFHVREGVCHVLFALDAGREIRVEEAARILGAAQAPPAAEGRPPYLHFERPPVRCTVRVAPVEVAGARTAPEATVVLYEFGAVSVAFALPATGALDELARLSAALGETDDLAAAARGVVEVLTQRLSAAIDGPEVSPIVEEYLVFHAGRVETDVPVARWTADLGRGLAAVLRGDARELSSQEVAQTLGAEASFTPGDLVLVDWNAAFVARERADDVLAVLGFANVQLLEMRFLDARLDADLARSYEAVRRYAPARALAPAVRRGALEQVARRQIDAALLFEHVRNAPKLLGDQYLARVYEHAARRFRLLDWNDALHRKIEVLGTIYERLRDRGAITRAEVLEWIIILLILTEVVLGLVR